MVVAGGDDDPAAGADVGGVFLDDAAELVVERLEDLVEQEHRGEIAWIPASPRRARIPSE